MTENYRYAVGETVKCPLCETIVVLQRPGSININSGEDFVWFQIRGNSILTYFSICPNCGQAIISISYTRPDQNNSSWVEPSNKLIWPSQLSNTSQHLSIPAQIAEDYVEAMNTLQISPKASAALSRRCLQAVLNDQGFSQRNLSDQIDAAKKTIPGYISTNLDAVREIGNFSAHQIKSQTTGEIVDVEPEEAEWNLSVLKTLFQFYYIQPAEDAARREALNKKLTDAGRKTI